jgi:hypothetical protein
MRSPTTEEIIQKWMARSEYTRGNLPCGLPSR